MTYHPSWIATHDREWSNIARYHSTCSDYSASTDPATLKHKDSLAHPGPIVNDRDVNGCCLVVAYRFIEIVGSTVLLKEHAVRTNHDAFTESGSVDPASWTDTRAISHM